MNDTMNNTADDNALTMALLAEGLRPRVLTTSREQALHMRLRTRVGASANRHRNFRTVRKGDQVWQNLTAGVRACVLNDDNGVRTALVEFEPGTRLPGHRHFEHEECVVLRGSLRTGDLVVHAHDYHLAPSGSKHPSIGSEDGALIFLRGTSIGNTGRIVRELVSAWLPGRGAAPTTIHAHDGDWIDTGEGAHIKALWINGDSASVLVRLDAGGRLPRHLHAQDEECFAVEGEAFLGDILLRAGEYQMAPRNTSYDEMSSDVGGLLFLHTSADFSRLTRAE